MLFYFLFSLQAFAIPELKTILSRTAENHGRGLYSVEQEVHFAGDSVVKETWLIKDENTMRLQFEGVGSLKNSVQGTIIYDGGRKYFLDESGLKQTRTSDSFFEPFFHFRFSKNFRAKMLSTKVFNSELAKDRPAFIKGISNYTPPPYVRLSRSGGVVTYAIGQPSEPDSKPRPGVWIEQDQFLIRKVRTADQMVVSADQYQNYAANLWLPKSRLVSWGPNTVQIQILDVRSLGKGSPDQLAKFHNKSLNGITKTAGAESLHDFYAHYR